MYNTYALFKKFISTYDYFTTFNKITYIMVLRGFGTYSNSINFEKISRKFKFKKIDLSVIKYLNKKFNLVHNRPYNSPYNRIMQFNNLLNNTKYNLFLILLKLFINTKSFNEFVKNFIYIVNTGLETKRLGKEKAMIILYNYFLPVLYVYSKFFYIDKDKLFNYINKTINFESNFINRGMLKIFRLNKKIHKEIMNLGIYYIYNNWCKKKECEKCLLYNLS